MSETKNYTSDQYAKFLESLKVTKKIEEKHPEWIFDGNLENLYYLWKNLGGLSEEATEYLFERCRHAESNAKPSDLAEQVKGFIDNHKSPYAK